MSKPFTDYDGYFYDRNGKPITMKEWCTEFGNRYAFQKEKHTNGFRILTKWTGVDFPEFEWMAENHYNVKKWTPGPTPMIFVTYVWNEDQQLVYSKRYAKIEDAYEAHFKVIEEFESIDFGTYVPLLVNEEEYEEESV